MRRCCAAPPVPVHELFWIAVGGAAALATTLAWRLLSANQRTEDATEVEPVEVTPRSVQTRVAPETHELALSMASELASLVSAVEARAHHLIEAAPTRDDLPGAAEAMLASIGRVQHLHAKLVAFGRARPVESGTTDVLELIAGLGDELQQMQLGLELRWDPPGELPRIDADPGAVRDAILFVCGALLRVERGATRLTFTVERSFSTELPTIQVELNLEWITVPDRREAPASIDHLFALDWEAAKHLIESHGGELTLSHLPGKAVHAVVRLPVVMPDATEAPASPPPPLLAGQPSEADSVSSHSFGGALVLESDPALRAVLARELKASGRAVFACADGESAHTFLQATPDRFELLIVDDAQHLEEHTPLAATIRASAPALKICLVTPIAAPAPSRWPELQTLKKPFGVHELRRMLASLLATH